MTSQTKTHLVLILDLSPATHLLSSRNNDKSSDPSGYEKCLNSVTAFCATHLVMDSENKINIIGSHCAGNDILYPLRDDIGLRDKKMDGQHEVFARVSQTVHQKIRISVQKCRSYLQNMDKSRNGNGMSFYPMISGALAIGMCSIQKHKAEFNSSRITIIATNAYDSSAFSSQYMNFMNIYFTAQKLGIPIDVCVLGPSEVEEISQIATIFQQGCDLTGGLYMRVSNVNAFLEYLVWTMLPDIDLRNKLVLPTQKKISYKATCFCHRTLIDIGYVCSVCLSISCKFIPICTTCHTVFKLPSITPMMRNKRKSVKGS